MNFTFDMFVKTYEQYIVLYPELNYGQVAFYLLEYRRPEIALMLKGEGIDPFYVNSDREVAVLFERIKFFWDSKIG